MIIIHFHIILKDILLAVYSQNIFEMIKVALSVVAQIKTIDFNWIDLCKYLMFLQIGHKYAERRLLVAQACGALAPYLMVTIQLDIERMLVQCFMLVQQRRHWTNIKPTKVWGLVFLVL